MIRRAILFMYAGAVLGVLNGIGYGLVNHGVKYSYSAGSASTTTVYSFNPLVTGVIIAVTSAAAWLWMAWKTGAGRSWARVLSSVFFAYMCYSAVVNILYLVHHSVSLVGLIVFLAEWAVGLAAIIHLWSRESTQFFDFTKQAKLARKYGAAHPPYQTPGYGPQPQYGSPPQYEQPPQYGQPPENGWQSPPQ